MLAPCWLLCAGAGVAQDKTPEVKPLSASAMASGTPFRRSTVIVFGAGVVAPNGDAVTSQNPFLFDGTLADEEALQRLVTDQVKRTPDVEIHLRAGREVKVGAVRRAITACAAAGVSNMVFVSRCQELILSPAVPAASAEETVLSVRPVWLVRASIEVVNMPDEQIVEIDEQGKVEMNGKEFRTWSELAGVLTRYRQASDAANVKAAIAIEAPDSAAYGGVMDVFNVCTGAGIKNVSLGPNFSVVHAPAKAKTMDSQSRHLDMLIRGQKRDLLRTLQPPTPAPSPPASAIE